MKNHVNLYTAIIKDGRQKRRQMIFKERQTAGFLQAYNLAHFLNLYIRTEIIVYVFLFEIKRQR
jgi:hypothetical protein